MKDLSEIVYPRSGTFWTNKRNVANAENELYIYIYICIESSFTTKMLVIFRKHFYI